MRRARIVAATVVGSAVVAVVAVPSTAWAHGVDSVPATNERPIVLEVTPATEGVAVRIVDAGRQLELRNDTGVDVVVLGYDGEPYLRAGPGGAFRNRRSPATYWNDRSDTVGMLPAGYDPTAQAEWERLSSAPRVRWHDHRLHWQGSRLDPDAPRRVLAQWTVELRLGARRIAVHGEIVHAPPPSPLVPVAAGLAVALAAVVAARAGRWQAALGAALGSAAVLAAVDVAGRWEASSRDATTKVLDAVYVLGGIALSAWATARLAHRRADPYATTPLALLAGVVVAIALGLAGLPWLRAAYLPTTLPFGFARTVVTTGVGAAAGAALVAGSRLRRPISTPVR